MSSSFTRGPWIADWAELTTEVIKGEPASRGRFLLGIYATPKDEPEATYVILPWKWAENCQAMIARDADVNLIQAAPQLLEACQVALDALQDMADVAGDAVLWNAGGQGYAACEQLRAAIAAAEGN